MANNRLLTQQDLHARLEGLVRGRKAKDVALEIGVQPTVLGNIRLGSPVTGKVLAWMGYEKAEALYRKVQS